MAQSRGRLGARAGHVTGMRRERQYRQYTDAAKNTLHSPPNFQTYLLHWMDVSKRA
jgi:hypothetical protein